MSNFREVVGIQATFGSSKKFRKDKAIMYFPKFFNALAKPRNLNFSQNKLYISNV